MANENTLLQAILDVLRGGGGVGTAVSITNAVATPTITDVASSGTVAAGAKSLSFQLYQPGGTNFVGTILGKAYDGADFPVVTIPIPANHTSAAVAYTRTSGTLTIFKTT